TLIRAGISTTMVDVNQDILDSGSARARQLAAGRSKSKAGQADDAEPARIASLLSTSTSPAPLADCDVVIEAVTENEAIKTGIFEALAGVLRDEAILASNTSTIPISRMARSWVHPERFAGMHFFHPAQRMELVEVIRGEQTDDQAVTALVDLAKRLGKTPIVVRDCPGFLVTRVLFPYLSQALELLLEGVPMDAIDAAAVQFGMPTGPIALYDFIGLDTVLAISRVMAEGYPDHAQTSPLLVEMVRLGRLGQKSGAGFRKHDRNESRRAADPAFESLLRQYQHHANSQSPAQEEITDRLFLPMLLEAIRTVDDGIVREPADVDVGVTLGLAFPASRGGILAWCDSEGAGAIMDRAARYEYLGPAFQPPAALPRMAGTKGSFHAPTSPATTVTMPLGPVS
ncbi:MAG: 3-hydroxyacyl-CoA dehydrogenase NAD-binding domain-containing protein, partial [Isosphaeraceae bacterium]